MRNPPRVLVFANRIKTVQFLHGLIEAEGFKTAILHGDRSQPERDVSCSMMQSRNFLHEVLPDSIHQYALPLLWMRLGYILRTHEDNMLKAHQI